MNRFFLPHSYDHSLVLLSVIIGIFASYIALDLARRVHADDNHGAKYWLVAGSLVMGSGIWSMHFVGMLAFSLPIRLAYDLAITFLSWFAALSTSYIALSVASRPGMTLGRYLFSSVAMGGGICVMHYTGMVAMKIQPAIQWQAQWFALSVAIAVTASFVALKLFVWMRNAPSAWRIPWQMAAAIVMGLAIAGMHYSGMAAADFPLGSICLAASSTTSPWLAAVVGTVTMFLLAATLAKSTLDARIQDRLADLNGKLIHHNAELTSLNNKLSVAQEQLLQSDKLASIGQLAAGVAHEINNPLGFIGSNITTLGNYVNRLFELLAAYEAIEPMIGEPESVARLNALRERIELGFLREDIPGLLRDTKDGVVRVRRIVQDLRDFSRADSNQDWQMANLHQSIDSTLNIIASEIKPKADVIKEYGELPDIECLPSQLNQVILNLIINAVQAIGPDRGRITIRTGSSGEQVWIEITDTGTGIAEQHLTRIFDPFFTTKPVGKGTGLGLSLSYGIIQKHHGRIEVQSEEGKGSSFKIILPVSRSQEGSEYSRSSSERSPSWFGN